MTLTEDQKFELVEEIWDSYECPNDCPYLNCWEEPQPYGSTVAYEALCDCDVLDGLQHLNADDCPKLKDKIFDLEWEKEQNE